MTRFIKHARVEIFIKRPYALCWRLGRFSAEEGTQEEGLYLEIMNEKDSLVHTIVNIDQAICHYIALNLTFNSNLLDHFLVLLNWGIHLSSIFPKWTYWR